jgi:hypothetical protein
MLTGWSKVQRIVLSLEWGLQSGWRHWSLCSSSIVHSTVCSPAKESTPYIDWNLKIYLTGHAGAHVGRNGFLPKYCHEWSIMWYFMQLKWFVLWDVMWQTLKVEAAGSSEVSVLNLHGIPSQNITFKYICVYLLGIVHLYLSTRLCGIIFQKPVIYLFVFLTPCPLSFDGWGTYFLVALVESTWNCFIHSPLTRHCTWGHCICIAVHFRFSCMNTP